MVLTEAVESAIPNKDFRGLQESFHENTKAAP
jgi:hypothetical protein